MDLLLAELHPSLAVVALAGPSPGEGLWWVVGSGSRVLWSAALLPDAVARGLAVGTAWERGCSSKGPCWKQVLQQVL